jgi:hypothetical protein
MGSTSTIRDTSGLDGAGHVDGDHLGVLGSSVTVGVWAHIFDIRRTGGDEEEQDSKDPS